jgi:hypothetical protein
MELTRALLSLPYIPYDMMRTDLVEMAVARRFAEEVTTRLPALMDVGAARDFDEELQEAKEFHRRIPVVLKKWIAQLDTAPKHYGLLLYPLTIMVVKVRPPYLTMEFALTAPAACNRHYYVTEPDADASAAGMVHAHERRG